MLHSLANLLAWFLILVVAMGSGYLVTLALRLPRLSLLELSLISTALGLGLLIYGTAVLGFLQLLFPDYFDWWVSRCHGL